MIKVGIALLVGSLFCISVSANTFNTNISVGARGNEVKVVQEFLIAQGLLVAPPTSYFGEQTKKAVQSFQRQNGISATGGWFALTRQKAELQLNRTKNISITTAPSLINSTVLSIKNATSTSVSVSKDVMLTISNTSGGTVYSGENTFSCYSGEICKKAFPVNKKITLKAVQSSGYIFKGWSEANCGNSLECTILLLEDSTVYARFEVPKPMEKKGYITSLVHPSDICTISLGRDSCDLNLRWINNTGLDMTIKINDDEYYLKIDDDPTTPQIAKVSPGEISKAIAENSSGPLYFTLYPHNTYTIVLKSGDKVLDTVSVKVKCEDGLYWDGGKCWEKGANRLYVYKQQGAVITSSIPGINCGYTPEKCMAGFSQNATVTLKATMLPGYSFGEWNNGCSGKESTCTIVMNKEKSVGFTVFGSAPAVIKKVDASIPEVGKPVPGCVPDWRCDNWGQCMNSQQTRYCYDSNKCNVETNKPQTLLTCETKSWNLNNDAKMVH